MATQAFKVQRGTTTFADTEGSKTITAGVDYTAPSAATAAFIRITNTVHTGMGATSGGGIQNNNDVSVYIDTPGNIVTSVTFTRNGSSGTNRVDWEIIEYVGEAGGANEFIVRDAQGYDVSDARPKDGPTISTIVDSDDVVCFLTGVGGNTTNAGAQTALCWFMSLIDDGGGDYHPRIDKEAGSASGYDMSYAVVEFTGSNWTVDRVEFTDTGTTWTGAGNSNSWNYTHGLTLADTSKTLIHVQYSSSAATIPYNVFDAVGIASTTQFKLYQRSSNTPRRKVVWVMQNSQADATARNLEVQHLDWADDTTSGSEERSFTQSVTAVDALEETSVFLTSSSNGNTLNTIPINQINYRLTATDTLTLTESENSEERRFLGQVVQWPEDPSAAAVTSTNKGTSGNKIMKKRGSRLKSRIHRGRP